MLRLACRNKSEANHETSTGNRPIKPTVVHHPLPQTFGRMVALRLSVHPFISFAHSAPVVPHTAPMEPINMSSKILAFVDILCAAPDLAGHLNSVLHVLIVVGVMRMLEVLDVSRRGSRLRTSGPITSDNVEPI